MTKTPRPAPICVAAFYQFARWPDFASQQPALQAVCDDHGVRGTILLAQEGVNGTIAGSAQGVEAVLDHLRALPHFADLEHKISHAETMPFHRMKVRLKREIVTMGEPSVDPTQAVGAYVEPAAWNALIQQPDVAVIDVRNAYEVGIGSFDGAIDPRTESFRDFPSWFRQFREANPNTKLAMFCTGGIRCEKATAFALQAGADEVFHLKGGILKYLETVPEDESLWRGECFVFDQRVSVGHGLTLGSYDQCHACRRPIRDEDKASPDYVLGVSCPACAQEFSSTDKSRFAERQKQVELAETRGASHIGATHCKPADD